MTRPRRKPTTVRRVSRTERWLNLLAFLLDAALVPAVRAVAAQGLIHLPDVLPPPRGMHGLLRVAALGALPPPPAALHAGHRNRHRAPGGHEDGDIGHPVLPRPHQLLAIDDQDRVFTQVAGDEGGHATRLGDLGDLEPA